jgi:hypothetical protein
VTIAERTKGNNIAAVGNGKSAAIRNRSTTR